ncbi:MAG: DUF4115 domain-containing protein [Armatimonadetes bacterium]|nr:DUF4115 domain-containing protein [Armatimonadota bacterium]
MDTIGGQLRAAREARGWTIQDVYERTRMSRSSIEAMEADDFASFAGVVYAKVFLRDYCRVLGIDDGPLVLQIGERAETQPEPAPEPRSVSLNLYWLVLTLCIVAAGLAIVKFVRSGQAPSRHGVQRPGSASQALKSRQPGIGVAVTENESGAASSSIPGQSAMNSGAVRVRLRAVEPTWVRLTSGGKLLFEGILPAEAVKDLTSPKPVRMRVGNAGGVYLRVDEGAEKLLGATGQVVERDISASTVSGGTR